MPGLNKRTTLPNSGAYGGFGPCGRGLGPGGRRRWFQRGFSGMGMRMRMRKNMKQGRFHEDSFQCNNR